jgi:hypothetical protein
LRFAVRRPAVPRGHRPSEGGLPASRGRHLTPAPAADRPWHRDDRGLPVIASDRAGLAAPGGRMLAAPADGTLGAPGRRTLARLLIAPATDQKTADQETHAPAGSPGLPRAASAAVLRPRRVPPGLLGPAPTAGPGTGPRPVDRPVALEEVEPTATGPAAVEAVPYGPCPVAVVEPGRVAAAGTKSVAAAVPGSYGPCPVAAVEPGRVAAAGSKSVVAAVPGSYGPCPVAVVEPGRVAAGTDDAAYGPRDLDPARVPVGRPVAGRAARVPHLGEVTAGLLVRHVSQGRPGGRRPVPDVPSAAPEIPRRERRSLPGRRAGALAPRVR